MPVGYSSPARNLFLLGSSGEQVVSNFFAKIDKSAGTDGVYLPDDIKYTGVADQKYILSGSASDSNSKGFGWLEKRDYDGTSAPLDWDVRVESTTTAQNTTLKALELDNAGNLIVVGKTGTVPWIAKYSDTGVIDWQSTTNSADVEYNSITSDSNLNYYACGNTPTSGSAQAFVEKFDINGNPGWGKHAFMLGRDVELEKIAANNRGQVVAVGNLEDDSAYKGYIVKIDTTTGDVLWDRTLESSELLSVSVYKPVLCHGVFIDDNDQIYVVGRVFNTNNTRGFIIKYSPEGNIIWQKETPDNEHFEYYDVKSNSDVEQTIVFGRYLSGGKQYGILTKYAKNGDVIFRRVISSSNDSGANFGRTGAGGAVNLDADPSFYYLLFIDDAIDGFSGTPETYTFGKVSSSGNGFGDFQYYDGIGTLDYEIVNVDDRIGRLSDGSVRQDSSDLITYPFTANKIVFDDLATQVSNKKRQMDSADSFEYSGSPAIRIADFQELNIGSESESSSTTTTTSGVPTNQQEYTSAGTFSWTAPTGVTSVSVVCVGGGGGAVSGDLQGSSPAPGGAGGGGGGLGWKNNISVTPGQSYTVVVGAGGTGIETNTPANAGDGGDSYFISTNTVKGGGGQGGQHYTAGTGGSYTGDGGGNGGNAADRQNGGGGGGGGGAGGYSGNGGNAGTQSSYGGTQFVAGGSGSGGAGGGASTGWGDYSPNGGGTEIYGQGANGNGGNGGSSGTGGCQGSNVNGTQTVTTEYGGGAGGGVWGGIYNGGSGAVRLIWGNGRAFPSTLTADQTPAAGGDVTTTTTVVTALDQSGKGNNCIVSGATLNVAGYWEFDGTDNEIITGPKCNTLFEDGGSGTIEMWVRTNNVETRQTLCSGYLTSGSTRDDRWDFEIRDFRIRGGSHDNGFFTGTTTLSADTWYHIVFTLDKSSGAGTLKAYLNAVEDQTQTFSLDRDWATDVEFGIGNRFLQQADFPLDADVAEVRTYPRALTAAAVFQNYNSTKSKYINEAPYTAPKIGPGIVTDSSLLLNYDFGNRATYDPLENLFQNSNLCQDTSTAIPYGWNGWNPAEFLKMSHLNGPFGDKSAKVVAHGAVNQNGGGLRGDVTGLVPGATYTVSAYVRKISEEELAYWNANNSKGLTTGTTDGAQDVSWFAATKCRWELQNISGTGDTPAAQITLSDQWQRIERDFPASSDGDKRLILSNNVSDTGTGNEDGGGVFLISALQLERKFNTLFGGNNKAGIWFATPYDFAIPSTSTIKNLITDSYSGILDGAAYNKSGHLDFEGTDDCIQLSDAFPTGNNAWTWSAWIKPHYSTDGTILFAGTESAGQAMWSFCQDGEVRVGIWGNDYVFAGTAIADDTWGMTTWTFDGSTLTCYTNGQSDGTGTGLSFNITGSSVKIGSALTTNYFGGGIAQVQIYNRALTAAEVAKNYNATVSEFANRTDPFVEVTNEGYTPPVTGGGDLYPFTSAYFTVSQALTDDTTSQEHRFGPSQSQVRGWLSGTANGGGGHTWADTYVDCPQDGYQRWQIPKTGKYTITAKGGGAGQCQQGYIGRGVKVIADFNLTKGDYLILAAGQGVPDDLNSDSCNGGGGATWVMSGSNYLTAVPLIVANGAGGDSSDGTTKDQPNIVLGSSFTVTPTAAQGGGPAVTGKQTIPILSNVYSSLAFGEGDNDTTQPNSAGWLTDGEDVPGQTPGIGGHCFRTDLIGGTRSDSSAGYGGFGGGSGGQDEEGNAGGGFTGAHGNDNNDKTGHGSTFVNDNNQGNVSVQLAQATTTYQNSDYTSEDQYQGWIKIEFVS